MSEKRFKAQLLAEEYINRIELSEKNKAFFQELIDSEDLPSYARRNKTTLSVLGHKVKKMIRDTGVFRIKREPITDEMLHTIKSMTRQDAILYLETKGIVSPMSDNVYMYSELGADVINSLDLRKSYALTVEVVKRNKWITEVEAKNLLQDYTLSEILAGKDLYFIDRWNANLKNCMLNYSSSAM